MEAQKQKTDLKCTNNPLLSIKLNIQFFLKKFFVTIKRLKYKIKLFTDLNRIISLLRKVDYYQSLYYFPLPLWVPHRFCVHRADEIYQHLRVFGKKKRILDIGCNLGYFSHYFAERDYTVHGIDSNPKHIEICQIQNRFSQKKICFSTAQFSEEFLQKINPQQYDIALLLSVIHHIIRATSLSYTQNLMKQLTQKVPTVLVELVTRVEPPEYWFDILPHNELEVFATCENIVIEKVTSFPNHLNDILRPVYLIKSTIN